MLRSSSQAYSNIQCDPLPSPAPSPILHCDITKGDVCCLFSLSDVLPKFSDGRVFHFTVFSPAYPVSSPICFDV